MKKMIIITLCMFATMNGCGRLTSLSSSSVSNENETTVVMTTEASIIASTEKTTMLQTTTQLTPSSSIKKEIPKSMVCRVLANEFSKSFGENVEVHYQENVDNYVIMFWQDGIAAEVEAIPDDQSASSAWSGLSSSLCITCSTLLKTIQPSQPNAHVTIMLLNDKDHSATLLTILDGKVIFNAPEDMN